MTRICFLYPFYYWCFVWNALCIFPGNWKIIRYWFQIFLLNLLEPQWRHRRDHHLDQTCGYSWYPGHILWHELILQKHTRLQYGLPYNMAAWIGPYAVTCTTRSDLNIGKVAIFFTLFSLYYVFISGLLFFFFYHCHNVDTNQQKQDVLPCWEPDFFDFITSKDR